MRTHMHTHTMRTYTHSSTERCTTPRCQPPPTCCSAQISSGKELMALLCRSSRPRLVRRLTLGGMASSLFSDRSLSSRGLGAGSQGLDRGTCGTREADNSNVQRGAALLTATRCTAGYKRRLGVCAGGCLAAICSRGAADRQQRRQALEQAHQQQLLLLQLLQAPHPAGGVMSDEDMCDDAHAHHARPTTSSSAQLWHNTDGDG